MTPDSPPLHNPHSPASPAPATLPPLAYTLGSALLLGSAAVLLGSASWQSAPSSSGLNSASSHAIRLGTGTAALICAFGCVYAASLAARRLWARWHGIEPPDSRTPEERERHRMLWIARGPFLLIQIACLVYGLHFSLSPNARFLASLVGLVWWFAYELVYTPRRHRSKQP